MEYENFDQLKADVGLTEIEECSQQENSEFAEMEKNGQPIPENIRKMVSKGAGDQRYASITTNVSTDKEKLYVLMKISKDLRIIKILIGVALTLAIVAFLLSCVFQ